MPRPTFSRLAGLCLLLMCGPMPVLSASSTQWQPVLERPAVKAEGGVGLTAMRVLREDLATLYRVIRRQGSANDYLFVQDMATGLGRRGQDWYEYYTRTLQFVLMVAENGIGAHNRQAYKQEKRRLQDIHNKLQRYRRRSLAQILARSPATAP